MRCKGVDGGCCTKENPCSIGDGDCDNDDHCAGDLTCGKGNCMWGGNDDCCTGTKGTLHLFSYTFLFLLATSFSS